MANRGSSGYSCKVNQVMSKPLKGYCQFVKIMENLRVVGCSGLAGIKAGSGTSNPVSGSHFPLPETKPEFGIGIGIGIWPYSC